MTTEPTNANPHGTPSATAATTEAARTDLLILLYGIRDRGAWTHKVKAALETPTLKVVPIPYGYFNVFQFLTPFFFRRRAIQHVERNLRNVIAQHRFANPTAQISILAHSFGCYVVANMLARDPFLNFKTLAFCGSVLSYTFPSDILLRQVGTFVNDCGNKDNWPVVAARITWGYGDTGTFGFGLTANDRFHNFGHGGFFTPEFIEKYWQSLFHQNLVVNADPPTELSWFRRLLLLLPLKWLLLAAILFLLWWLWPRINLRLSQMGFELSPFLTIRYHYSLRTIPVTPHYFNTPAHGLVPPNSAATMEADLVQAMFVWKKWTRNAAKPPVGDQTKCLVVVWSDEQFPEDYFTFNVEVHTGTQWQIVEGCAFLTHDRDDVGKHRSVYRQLDLDIPVSHSVLEHSKLEVSKPSRGDKLLMILRVESADGSTRIPKDASDLGIGVTTR